MAPWLAGFAPIFECCQRQANAAEIIVQALQYQWAAQFFAQRADLGFGQPVTGHDVVVRIIGLVLSGGGAVSSQ